MENYNYHGIGTNYYEDKSKSVKKKNQSFVTFGITRSKHSRLHFLEIMQEEEADEHLTRIPSKCHV